MSLIIPGGELKTRIDKLAAGIAEKPQWLAKLVEMKKPDLAFLLEGNEFHPYFLSVLHDFKQNPQSRAAVTNATNGSAAAGASATTAPQAPKPMTLLEKAIADARSLASTQDQHPDRFTTPMTGPNAVIPSAEMEIMQAAAFYTAKVGDDFWSAAHQRYAANSFRDLDFLKPEHPRHRCYAALRSAYALSLERSPAVIAELKAAADDEGWLDAIMSVCDKKKSYALAEAARRKASMLSEPELRAKLLWTEFAVVGRFNRADLGLTAVAAGASAQPRVGAVVKPATAATGSTSGASVPVIESYQATGRTVTAAGINYRDENGATISADVANEVVKGQLVGDAHFEVRDRQDKRLRQATGLADDEELQRNLLARFNRPQDTGPGGYQYSGPQV